MATRLFVLKPDTPEEQVVRIEDNDYFDALRDPDLEEAAAFVGSDGKEMTVRKSLVKTAIKDGYKPKVPPRALQQGAEYGYREYVRSQGWEAGGVGQGVLTIDDVIAAELEPFKFFAGNVGGVVAPALGGFAAARGAQAVGKKAAPAVRAVRSPEGRRDFKLRLEAASKGLQEGAESAPDIHVPFVSPLYKAAKGVGEGLRTWSVVGELQRALGDETGSVKVPMRPGEKPKPGVSLLVGGESPLADQITRLATTSTPTRLQPADIKKLITMGADKRTQAREFNAAEAAKSVVDDVDRLFAGFREDQGEAFKRLSGEARKKFWPAYGDDFRKSVTPLIERLGNQQYPPKTVIQALEMAREIINTGKGSDTSITIGPWNAVSNGEKFDRMQAARRTIRKVLDPVYEKQAKNISLDVSDVNALQNLQTAVDWLNTGLRKIPEKVKADQIYGEMSQIYTELFSGIRDKNNEINWPKLQGALQERGDDGKLFRERLGRMDKTLDKWKAEIPDTEYSTFKGIISRVTALADLAEQARFVKGQGWVEGPTSSAVEKAVSTQRQRIERGQKSIAEKGVPPDIFSGPSGSLAQFDNYVNLARKEHFGGKPIKDLSTREANAILEMFYWDNTHTGATERERAKVMKEIITNATTPGKGK